MVVELSFGGRNESKQNKYKERMLMNNRKALPTKVKVQNRNEEGGG